MQLSTIICLLASLRYTTSSVFASATNVAPFQKLGSNDLRDPGKLLLEDYVDENELELTYVEVIYTQSFADVLDQYPTPAIGEIGYGTLKEEEKRDAEPTTAADGQTAVVLELHTHFATIGVTPVYQITEIEIVERNSSNNGSASSIDGNNNSTLPFQMRPGFNDSAVSPT